jgi:hypothetical protein
MLRREPPRELAVGFVVAEHGADDAVLLGGGDFRVQTTNTPGCFPPVARTSKCKSSKSS